jgi:hypothetical protein
MPSLNIRIEEEKKQWREYSVTSKGEDLNKLVILETNESGSFLYRELSNKNFKSLRLWHEYSRVLNKMLAKSLIKKYSITKYSEIFNSGYPDKKVYILKTEAIKIIESINKFVRYHCDPSRELSDEKVFEILKNFESVKTFERLLSGQLEELATDIQIFIGIDEI